MAIAGKMSRFFSAVAFSEPLVPLSSNIIKITDRAISKPLICFFPAVKQIRI
jgi:hypothetical protein